MSAPKKIYLSKLVMAGAEILDKPVSDDDVEYIRKDALLKWLEGKMTVEGATEGIVGGYDFALKDVIKHIESL